MTNMAITFFTNEPGSTLLDRLRKTLKDVSSSLAEEI